jgi:hypothetical protein
MKPASARKPLLQTWGVSLPKGRNNWPKSFKNNILHYNQISKFDFTFWKVAVLLLPPNQTAH